MPGPIPARDGALARPRSRNGRDRPAVTKGVLRPTSAPAPDKEWHPIAATLYKALSTSGQCDWYQDSDWAFAYSLCDDLSYYKQATRRSGQMLQTIYSAFERLLVTEGDRRRVRIELHEPEEKSNAAVLAIADYQRDLGV